MARELGVLNALDVAKTQLYHFTAIVIAGMGFLTDAYDLGVLNALDVAKIQLYHFNAIVTAGMGFFTAVYDLFCISLVTKLLGRLYYTKPDEPKPGTLPPGVQSAVTGVALCGALAGELFFDWLGDKMGRKRVCDVTLMLMVVCSIASGVSFGATPKGDTDMATLCLFGFWLGFGIGGDYPLSATIMSEYANKKTRGAFIAAVFAMQELGILAGGIITLIVLTLCGTLIKMFPSNVTFCVLMLFGPRKQPSASEMVSLAARTSH